mmetsp:Transcript_8348/g.7393  ORF Transcript_8348/g.7393 Transcript_8348/m.7393 type:complete len:106 (-) Transcript_8348:50-367(-)
MGFLNKEKIIKNASIIQFTKSNLEGSSSIEESKGELRSNNAKTHEINELKQFCNGEINKSINEENDHDSLKATFKRPSSKPLEFINEEKKSYKRPRTYLKRRQSD